MARIRHHDGYIIIIWYSLGSHLVFKFDILAFEVMFLNTPWLSLSLPPPLSEKWIAKSIFPKSFIVGEFLSTFSDY